MDTLARLSSLRRKLLEIEPLMQALLDKCEGRTYLVGGALRDGLLDREIVDLDLAVEADATPLGKALAKQLGGTFVPLDPDRDEGRLVLGERPEVDLSGLKEPIETDLARRDFTINALAIPLRDLLAGESTLIDPFGGIEDISSGTVRAVADDSFVQDPVRILRALRFSSQLGFSIEEKTLRRMERDCPLLVKCPGERVWNELELLLHSPNSSGNLMLAARTGILEMLFPELKETRAIGQAKGPIQNLFEHSLLTYGKTEELMGELEVTPFAGIREELAGYLRERTPLLKLSALLHDIGKPQAEIEDNRGVTHFYGHESIGAGQVKRIARERLRLSNRETKVLTTLIANHMRPHLLAREEQLTRRAMRRFFRDCDEEGLGVLLLSYADGLASTEDDGTGLERAISQLLSFHQEESSRPKLKRLITGDDLIEELEMKPSPIFRVILKEVEERQLEGEIRTREEALSLAKKMAREETKAL